ncbi:MAG: DUF1176 domain-containing protein [Burkholderiaceae bacterium]|nr:DUF1176 domain-containing protein [Burkholderiaceae bacterium]
MNACGALTLSAAMALAPALAGATGFTGIYFQHHDWEMACDNTGTCRAAGYQEDRYVDAVKAPSDWKYGSTLERNVAL